jgi:glycogen operon protein
VDEATPLVSMTTSQAFAYSSGGNADSSTTCAAGSTFEVETRSLLVLREHVEPELEVDHSVAASVALASGTTERRAPRKEKR